MRKQQILFSILTIILCAVFFGCEGIATLFHGPKPEEPPVTYTVTYDANGATEGTPPITQTVNTGTVISLPNQAGLIKTGFDFVGWSENPNGTPFDIGSSITVTRDMVFYARWFDLSTDKYTVTFHANGANGTPPAPRTVYEGVSITVPGQGTLSLSGKVFGGWNTESNGGGTNYAAGATYTVNGNVTLFAKWQSAIQYTVTYHANGASGTAPTAQKVDPGTDITLPDAGSLTYIGRTFEGWNTNANGTGTSYEEGDSYTVNASITFYARWLSVPITPPGATLVQQLAYIRNNAGDGVVYNIVVNNDEYIGPQSVSTMGRNIIVNISSASPADVKTIQLEGQGYLFSVDANITLKLQDIVLRGHSMNTVALVGVGSGGTLILNSGAKITQNTNTSSGKGGGVYVNNGVLELNDGSEISFHEFTYKPGISFCGGGIYAENRGNVTIRGGLISENIAVTNWGVTTSGGGIFITGNSTVSMTGGIISKNQCRNGNNVGSGGGIYVENGSSFTKRAASGSSTSGIIYGGTVGNANIAGNNGNAIYRNFGTKKERNSTLGGYDEISTLSDLEWE